MRITPYLNEFGRPIGAMLMFIDLTDVKQIDIALKNSNTYLHAVLKNVFDGIIVADERGNIESINLAAERIFGYRSDEAVGKNVNLLQPDPFKSEHDGYIQRYLKTGKAKIIGIGREVTGRRKDGHTFPMDLAVTEMRVHGQRKFVGIVRDLTARKQEPLVE
jgi:two-component system, NarL family, sensor histidine kinase EvgS